MENSEGFTMQRPPAAVGPIDVGERLPRPGATLQLQQQVAARLVHGKTPARQWLKLVLARQSAPRALALDFALDLVFVCGLALDFAFELVFVFGLTLDFALGLVFVFGLAVDFAIDLVFVFGRALAFALPRDFALSEEFALSDQGKTLGTQARQDPRQRQGDIRWVGRVIRGARHERAEPSAPAPSHRALVGAPRVPARNGLARARQAEWSS